MPFLLSSRLTLPAPHKPGSFVGFCERNRHDWRLGVKDDVLKACVRLFRVAVGSYSMFIDDNANPHKAQPAEDFLEELY